VQDIIIEEKNVLCTEKYENKLEEWSLYLLLLFNKTIKK